MLNLEQKIEALILFRNEQISYNELAKICSVNVKDIKDVIVSLEKHYKNRGIVVVSDEESVMFGTHPEASVLIEQLQKEELSKDLGRAGLETLSIVLYKSPVSRREIDYIRGVNSGFIIRHLLIRGLIERVESAEGERSYSYKPTLELLRYLGVGRKEDLPNYEAALHKIKLFVSTPNETDSTTTENAN